MVRERKYASNAERQAAYRSRKKVERPPKMKKVPKTQEKVGGKLGDIRPKKETETWEHYHIYLTNALRQAKGRGDYEHKPQADEGVKAPPTEETEDYYERMRAHEDQLKQSKPNGGKNKQNIAAREAEITNLKDRIADLTKKLERYKSQRKKASTRMEIRRLKTEILESEKALKLLKPESAGKAT